MAPKWVWKQLLDPKSQTIKQGIRGMCIGTGYQTHVTRVMIYEIENWLKQVGCQYILNKGEHSITLPNDAIIYFGSSWDPLSLEGPHLDGFCWIDEAGMMPLLAWEVAQRRTNTHASPILITTVPYFNNWLKSHVYDQWVAGDESIEWIKCRTSDNLMYDRASIERARRTMRPEKFRAFFEGDWSKAEGLIYPEPDDEDLIVDPFPIPDDWPCFAGHDWGVNDPTAGVWGRLSHDGTLYVVAEYEAGNMTIDDHAVVWDRLGLLHGTDEAFGDPEGKELMMRLRRLGYPIQAARLPTGATAQQGNSSILAGLDIVYRWLVTGRIKVFRGLNHLIDYRNSYVWAQDRRDEEKLLDRPKDPQPARHMMDALRYLVVGVDAAGQAQAATPGLSVKFTQAGATKALPLVGKNDLPQLLVQ